MASQSINIDITNMDDVVRGMKDCQRDLAKGARRTMLDLASRGVNTAVRAEVTKAYNIKKKDVEHGADHYKQESGSISLQGVTIPLFEVTYKGKSIADVLDMTVEEALDFFSAYPRISRKLQTLYDVGLGYIRLGQPSTTLSGGEAQRVKLATELSRRATGRTFYILDEPTTGLHMADVHKLIEVLQRLVDAGNTVLVIEHNLDVIKVADYIVDLGPEGGSGGGRIVACGTPEQIAACPESFTGKYLKKMLK